MKMGRNIVSKRLQLTYIFSLIINPVVAQNGGHRNVAARQNFIVCWIRSAVLNLLLGFSSHIFPSLNLYTWVLQKKGFKPYYEGKWYVIHSNII